MNDRYALLLAVVGAQEHAVSGRTRLQKYSFLVQERSGIDAYEFVPYDYGPFSRDLYQDVDRLIDRDWLIEEHREEESGRIWYYYDRGERAPGDDDLADRADKYETFLENAVDVRENFDDERLDTLLTRLYSEHPRMAANSIF